MQKNVAGQKIAVYAYDTVNDTPKTGDAANITAVISKDWAAAAASNDVNPTEKDATNEPGIYLFDATQAESNADDILFTPVSSTTGIVINPLWIKPRAPNYTKLNIDSDGKVLLQPSQPGVIIPTVTALTNFPEIEGLIIASGTIGGTGNDGTHVHLPTLNYPTGAIDGQMLVIGDNSANLHYSMFITSWDNATKLATVATLPFVLEDSTDDFHLMCIRRDPVGDRLAIGLASADLDNQFDSVLTAIATTQGVADAIETKIDIIDTNVDTLVSRLTAARAGYLDNLNVGGAVASQADINALNQSASRRIILTTVEQWERPETGTSQFYIEARLFDSDGAPANADSTPSIAVTGITTGDLSANLSASSNPSTGVYRWVYDVLAAATLEAVRTDVSVVIAAQSFTMAVMSQVCDFAAADFTTADRTKLSAIYDKLPSKSYLAGTANADGDIQLNEATGTLQDVTLAASQPNYAPLEAGDYVAPDNAGIADAVTAANDAATNASAASTSAASAASAASSAASAATTAASNTTDLPSMIETSGGHKRFKDTALEQAPAGGGGGGLTDQNILDIVAGVRAITVNVALPAYAGRPIKLVKNDDYVYAYGTHIPWELTNASGLVDMTDWTVKLKLQIGTTSVEYPGEFTSRTGATRAGYVEAASLASTLPGDQSGKYQFQFTNPAGTQTRTLIEGDLKLSSRI